MKSFLFAALAAVGLFAAQAQAADVVLKWNAPTACADNSALVNCPTTGYEVSAGDNSSLAVKETVGASVLTRTYTGLTPGRYCYALKTLSGSQKSDQSTVACADVPTVKPGMPGGVTVTITVTVSSS